MTELSFIIKGGLSPHCVSVQVKGELSIDGPTQGLIIIRMPIFYLGREGGLAGCNKGTVCPGGYPVFFSLNED